MPHWSLSSFSQTLTRAGTSEMPQKGLFAWGEEGFDLLALPVEGRWQLALD